MSESSSETVKAAVDVAADVVATTASGRPIRVPSLRPRTTSGASLADVTRIVGDFHTVGMSVQAEVDVTGVTLDSAQVRPGDLFAALPGAHAHGARFAAAAHQAGAVAVLTDAVGAALVPAGMPVLVNPHPRDVLGSVSAAVYGDPSRQVAVAGITGTSGKTTTTFLVRAGLIASGHPCGLIGTIGTFIDAEQLPGGLTTPEAPDLQALFAVLAERGVHHAAMEVSSHALTLGRVVGTSFAVAAFTNLSQDHLEFHPSMRDYFEAKARLFDGRADRHVVVVDDDWGRELAARLGPGVVTVSVGRPATWTASDIVTEPDGRMTFTAHGPRGAVLAGCAIPGRYNVANVLVALAVLDALDVPLERAAPAVAAAQVPGRMERIDAGQDFLAVVDYAHKPAAVDGALRALRPLTAGRLIVVLGCGGDRDREKRPVMGRVAAENADVLIVTDDNPRSEDPAAIRRAVLDGAVAARTGADVIEIGNRRAAIAAAVAQAGAGDTVLIAGKGHETGQNVAGVIHPFDDRAVLRDLLAGAVLAVGPDRVTQ